MYPVIKQVSKPFLIIKNCLVYVNPVYTFKKQPTLIGNIKDITLIINKNDLYFRRENKQDKCIGNVYRNQPEWQKFITSLKAHGFKHA